MSNGHLLWVDDEIEMLRPQILFLQNKGYDIVKATNGADAVDLCQEQHFDLILLDENMPGLSGLDTLQRIKEILPAVPVVMVTKSEEEDIMNQAIGANIADYLIKPVNPNQILLTLKKTFTSRPFRPMLCRPTIAKSLSVWAPTSARPAHGKTGLNSTSVSSIGSLNWPKSAAKCGPC